jgi:hypothetical protein
MNRGQWRGARPGDNIPFKLMTSLMIAVWSHRTARVGRDVRVALTVGFSGSGMLSQDVVVLVVVGRGLCLCGWRRRSVARLPAKAHGPQTPFSSAIARTIHTEEGINITPMDEQ